MSAREPWTEEQKQKFLDTLRRTANVTAATEVLGLSRRQAYATRKRDRDFRKAWDDALQAALDDLEAELRRRALDGVEQPVFYGGKECGRVRTYNDALGMFLLRGRRADVFNVRGQKAQPEDDGQGATGNARNLLMSRLARIGRRAGADQA